MDLWSAVLDLYACAVAGKIGWLEVVRLFFTLLDNGKYIPKINFGMYNCLIVDVIKDFIGNCPGNPDSCGNMVQFLRYAAPGGDCGPIYQYTYTVQRLNLITLWTTIVKAETYDDKLVLPVV